MDRVLEANPALLDETGSFTSSTLASRITKQFNLMGGAMAIDAGDSSSEAALSAACGLLRAGTSDAVLCAAGQRAMDLPSYQAWVSRGHLYDNGDNARLPGEGAVVFRLKRLSDAKSAGDEIFGVIENIELGSISSAKYQASAIEQQVGDWKSSRLLLDMAASLASQNSKDATQHVFESRNGEGSNYRVKLRVGDIQEVKSEIKVVEPSSRSSNGLLAAVFPGQGSQSPGMLDRIVSQSKAAHDALQSANGVLSEIGSPGFDSLCRSANAGTSAHSIWPIQGAVLIADLVYGAAWLEQNGPRISSLVIAWVNWPPWSLPRRCRLPMRSRSFMLEPLPSHAMPISKVDCFRSGLRATKSSRRYVLSRCRFNSRTTIVRASRLSAGDASICWLFKKRSSRNVGRACC